MAALAQRLRPPLRVGVDEGLHLQDVVVEVGAEVVADRAVLAADGGVGGDVVGEQLGDGRVLEPPRPGMAAASRSMSAGSVTRVRASGPRDDQQVAAAAGLDAVVDAAGAGLAGDRAGRALGGVVGAGGGDGSGGDVDGRAGAAAVPGVGQAAVAAGVGGDRGRAGGGVAPVFAPPVPSAAVVALVPGCATSESPVAVTVTSDPTALGSV